MWKLSILLLLWHVGLAKADTLEQLTYLTEEYPPSNYLENGEVKGLSVDLLKLVWKKLGVKPQKIHVYPWARAYYSVKNKDNYVLFTTSKTAERANLFQWACPIETIQYVLYTLQSNEINIASIEDLKAYVIGTVRYDGSEQILLKQIDTPLKIASNVSMAANLQMLKNNRVQLIAYNKQTAAKMFSNYGYNPDDFKIVFELQKLEGCFAFSKNINSDLIADFQRELTAIVNSPVYQKLLTKYHL